MFVVIIVSVTIILFIINRISVFITRAPCKSKVCLVGKTAVVTGGSTGIGYEIVLGLASRGCRVIIADKNIDQSIQDALIKETNNSNILMKYVDLASFKSVRELAEDLNSSEQVVDILINNAGIGLLSDITEDNLNTVMQVNYYSGFLLTHLLLGLLKKSTAGRILFTSSYLSLLHTISMKRVLPEKIVEEGSFMYYSDSKFLQIVAADAFAEKLRQFKISANTFHPYAVKTNIFKEVIANGLIIEYFFYYVIQFLLLILGQSPEDGAQTGIYLACANEVKQITGKFFGATIVNFKPRRANDAQLREAIWKSSEVSVKLQPSEKI